MRILALTLAFLCALAQAACAQAVLLAGFPPTQGPQSISFSGSTIVSSAAAGTFVGTLSTTGGTAPYTYTVSNSKFQIVGNQVQRSSTGTLTAGTPESLNFTSTDLNSNSTNTATNGQGAFSVSVTSSGATQLTQIKFVNPNVGATGTNFITNEVGLAFPDSSTSGIANGCTTGAPQFIDDATTTNIPFSESVKPICYPDGYLWFASFIFRDPVSIPGSSSATIDVESGGSYPGASSRTLSDFTAGGLDLNQQVTGLDSQLNSSPWECELSQGITANTTAGAVNQGYGYHYMTGAAGEVWRIQADFRQSGSSHGQLECWWYVASLQDGNGNLAGIRYLVRTTAPWYDVASPAQNFWSFATWGDYNGASLIADNWAGHEASIGFDWAGSGTSCTFQGAPPAGKCYTVTSGTPAWEYGNLIRLSTTGSLPGGLSTGTSYFVQNGDYEPYSIPYSKTQISISTSSQVANAFAIAATSTCASTSSTCTAKSYPYITPFGSLYDAQSNGTWNYIQGNGSIATDSGVRVVPNNAYTRSAKVIPPFCFSCFTVTDPTPFPFWPMTAGPITRAQNSTGERPDIAPAHGWAAAYWFNQSAGDEETVRTIGLAAGGSWPINMRSANSSYYGSLPVVNNKAGGYTNMSPYSSTIEYAVNGAVHGMTVPTNNSTVQFAGWGDNTMSHSPDFEFQAFIMTGEPEYMDMVEEFGDEAETNITNSTGNAASVGSTNSIHGAGGSTARNSVISGTTYYGSLLLSAKDLIRADAWPRRNEAEAAWMVTPENASFNTYFNDLEQNTTNAANAFVSLYGASFPWVTNNGMWYENSGSDCTGTDNAGCGAIDPWAMGYFLTSWNYSMALVPSDTNIATFVNYISKWFPHVDATFGTPYVGTYESIVRQSPNQFVTQFVTSDSNVEFQAAGMKLTWTSSTPTFTVSNNLGGYTPTNGDTIYWNPGGATAPGNFSANTQYFVCNASGNTFNLSASASPCTAIQPTNSVTNQTGWYFYSTSVTGTSHYLYAPLTNIGSGYSANILGGMEWSAANGASGMTTAINHLSTLIQNNLDGNYPGGYKAWPVYAYQSTY